MPNIRIMNWNIEQLSWKKINIVGMADAIAHVVVDNDIDILFIFELKTSKTDDILKALMMRMNYWVTIKNGNNPTDDYTTAIKSSKTGGDIYGVILKNPQVTDPVFETSGSEILSNIMQHQPFPPTTPVVSYDFETGSNLNLAYGTAAMPVVLNNQLPLLDLFARSNAGLGRKSRKITGQNFVNGGQAEGLGYRLPCLSMFQIAGTNNYLVPFVICHFAANRNVATSQITECKYLHITQIYRAIIDINGVEWNSITLNNVATRVENLVFAGDFNVDFLQNPADPASSQAYGQITSQQANSGGLQMPTYNIVTGGLAVLPVDSAQKSYIDAQANYQVNAMTNIDLYTGITSGATHLRPHPSGTLPVFMSINDQRDNCLDNFFYGGTDLEPNIVPAGIDDAAIIDLPFLLRKSGDPTIMRPGNTGIDIKPIADHFAMAGTRRANDPGAAKLREAYNANSPTSLNFTEKHVGAKLISDHLPVVIEFNLP